MSITVENPNEVAKVKHILSLAQSINDKIDAAISGSTSTDTPKTAASLLLEPITSSAATEKSVARSDLVITNDASAFILKSTSDGKPFVVSNSAAVAVDFFHATGKEANDVYWIMIVLTLGPVADWCNEPGEKAYNTNGDIIMENGGTGAGDLVIALAESDTYAQSNTVTMHITA